MEKRFLVLMKKYAEKKQFLRKTECFTRNRKERNR
jgi:hypothetical protein